MFQLKKIGYALLGSTCGALLVTLVARQFDQPTKVVHGILFMLFCAGFVYFTGPKKDEGTNWMVHALKAAVFTGLILSAVLFVG